MGIKVKILILLSIACLWWGLLAKAERTVVVDKPRLELYVMDDGKKIFSAPVCVGKRHGNKKRKGDMKTPEGTFPISMIQKSSSWKHDFGDGHGQRAGAYGPWFIRLKVPGTNHIGIHGTCFPLSIGTRDSEGCVRMYNDDV